MKEEQIKPQGDHPHAKITEGPFVVGVIAILLLLISLLGLAL